MSIEKQDSNPACNILVAEDGPDNQMYISFLLKKMGFTVTLVGDGQKALDVIRANAANKNSSDLNQAGFDLLLIDLQMPNVDGYDTVSVLREEGYTGPIIAITAFGKTVMNQNKPEGVQEVILKPFHPDKLKETILQYAVRDAKIGN